MAYPPSMTTLIQSLQALPGVGPRSAARMALELLERDRPAAEALHSALGDALAKVAKCEQCRTLTEQNPCDICSDGGRDTKQLCVVSNDADRQGIELSGKYRGHYFVLHGALSPIDGLGPEELGLHELKARLTKSEQDTEVLLALDHQMESEATVNYLKDWLQGLPIKLSRVPFHSMKSGALDQVDSRTIGQALAAKEDLGFELD